MKASIVDLRYKMNDVQKALQRNETVTIYYRGKKTGKIIPIHSELKQKKVEAHPLFGMNKKSSRSVSDVMKLLRGGRYKVNKD